MAVTFLGVLAAALVLGTVLGRCAPARQPAERWTLRLLLGLAAAAVVALLAGQASLVGAQGVLAVVAVGAALWCWRLPERVRSVPPEPPLNGLEGAAMGAAALALGLALLHALAPVTGWDAAVAHAALPEEYARTGHIYAHAGNVYSAYPHLVHSLAALTYAAGGERAAGLLAWTWSVGACAAAYCLGARLGGRTAGCITAALLATAPIFADQAGVPGVDLPFAALSTAALAAVLAWQDTRARGWLMAAGLLAGSACGVRHTGLVVCALLLAGPWFWRWPVPWRAQLTLAFGMALAAAPWLGRTGWVTGNPVYPFLLDWFGPGPMPHIAIGGVGQHETTAALTLWQALRFPYDIVMRPQDFDGPLASPGGAVLILGVPALLYGTRRAWQLAAFSAAGGAVFFVFQQLARYLLPFFVPMLAVAATAPQRLGRLRPLAIGVLVCGWLFGLALMGAAVHFKVPAALGLEAREDYLARRVERYGMFAYANEHCTGAGAILSFDQRAYYLVPRAYVNHWGLLSLRGQPLARQVDWLRAQGIGYVLVPVDYVRTSGRLARELGPLVQQWLFDRDHFERVQTLELPTGAGGFERVEVLRVRGAPQ